MGSAGDSPAPVGDPPTGTAESNFGERLPPLIRSVGSIPSGESPDGTGGSPVLPKTIFKTRSEGASLLETVTTQSGFQERAALLCNANANAAAPTNPAS